MSRASRTALLTGALVLGPLVGPSARAQRLEYGGGLSAATGEFIFTERSTSWVLTNGLQIAGERWRIGVSLPVITQNSTAITMVGGMPLPTGGPNAGPIRDRTGGESIPMQRKRGGTGGTGAGNLARASGGILPSLVDSGAVEGLGPYTTNIGDPFFDLGGDFFVSSSGAVRLGAQVFAKVPIADPESGVGTGAFDYGVGASFSMVADRALFFADVSHWQLGDLDSLPLSDLTSGSIGVGRTLGTARRLSVLASLNGTTAFFETVDPALSAGIGLGYAPRPGRFLSVNLTVGMSESVAEWTASVGWRRGITRSGWER